MKKQRKSSRIVMAALAVIVAVSIVLAGCTSKTTSGNSAVPEDLKIYLESMSKKTYAGADFTKENLQEILGICERSLTQEKMDQTISDFQKYGQAAQDPTTGNMVGLLMNIKALNLQLNTFTETVNNQGSIEIETSVKEAFSAELSDMITQIDKLGIFVAIDTLSLNGSLSVNPTDLKTGITQDFVTALTLIYLQDQGKAATNAKKLLETLNQQWLVEDESVQGEEYFGEGVKEVTEKEADQTIVTAEDQAAYMPEGGVLGDLLTDAEKSQAMKEGSFSNLTVENGQTAASTSSNGLDFNKSLKELLNSSGVKREELLKTTNDNIPSGWAKASINSETGRVVIVRKEKKTENNVFDMNDLFGNSTTVYPGAILYANNQLADGVPTEAVGLKRQSYNISSSLNGTNLVTIAGGTVGKTTVDQAIKDQISTFSGKAHKGTTYKWIDVSSESQLDAQLGISGAAKKWGIDVESCASGKKQTTLISLQQVYFSEQMDSATANQLIDPSVTQEELNKVFYKSAENDRLSGAYIQQVNYGRQIIVKLETSSCSNEVKAAWESAFFGSSQSLSTKYKEILSNTTYTVCVYGGSGSTAGELIKVKDMAAIKDILAKDSTYDGTFTVEPVSYTTRFIDTGDFAKVNKVSNYLKTTVEEHADISFKMIKATWYTVKYQELMGRKIQDVDQKTGKLILGPWEKIWSGSWGSHEFLIDGKYAEFGYSFDIAGGTDWPYSDVFWRTKNGIADKIVIDLGGGCRTATIKIDVNGNQVFYDGNCDSHDQKDWSKAN